MPFCHGTESADHSFSGIHVMPNTVKPSTIGWVLAAIFAPFIAVPLLRGMLGGVALSSVHIWIISIPLCGFLAYRSYKRSKPVAAPAATSEPSTAALATRTATPSPFGISLIGAALGFGVGYLTRPTFLGQPIPLQAMFQPVPAELAHVKTNFIMHMAVATIIGLVAAFILLKIVSARRG